MNFYRPKETIQKIWQKLIFIQLIYTFWEIYDLA